MAASYPKNTLLQPVNDLLAQESPLKHHISAMNARAMVANIEASGGHPLPGSIVVEVVAALAVIENPGDVRLQRGVIADRPLRGRRLSAKR